MGRLLCKFFYFSFSSPYSFLLFPFLRFPILLPPSTFFSHPSPAAFLFINLFLVYLSPDSGLLWLSPRPFLHFYHFFLGIDSNVNSMHFDFMYFHLLFPFANCPSESCVTFRSNQTINYFFSTLRPFGWFYIFCESDFFFLKKAS